MSLKFGLDRDVENSDEAIMLDHAIVAGAEYAYLNYPSTIRFGCDVNVFTLHLARVWVVYNGILVF